MQKHRNSNLLTLLLIALDLLFADLFSVSIRRVHALAVLAHWNVPLYATAQQPVAGSMAGNFSLCFCCLAILLSECVGVDSEEIDNQTRVPTPSFLLPQEFVQNAPEDAISRISENTYFIDNGTRFNQTNLSYSCQDDSSWLYLWPDVGNAEVHCSYYAPGAVNNAFCAYDVGLLLDVWSWTLAIDSCVQSCGECCKQFCLQNNFSTYSWVLNGINVGSNFTTEKCLSRCPPRYTTPSDAIFWLDPQFLKTSVRLNFSSPTNQVYNSYITFLQAQSESTNSTTVNIVSGYLGIFTDTCTLDAISDEPGTSIRFTINGEQPSLSNGALYAGGGITVRSAAVIKAVAFRPWEGESSISQTASVSVTIRTPVPQIRVLECGALLSEITAVQNDTSCIGEARFEVVADAGAYIWYTVDGSDPSNGMGTPAVSPARVSIYVSGSVRAVARRPGTVESLVASGPFVRVEQPRLVPSQFLATVGLWRMLPANSGAAGGGLVSFADEAAVLGNATLVWAASALWAAGEVGFPPATFSAVGLQLSPAATRGLLVTPDVGAPGGPLAAGELPRDKLSLEVGGSRAGTSRPACRGTAQLRREGSRAGTPWHCGTAAARRRIHGRDTKGAHAAARADGETAHAGVAGGKRRIMAGGLRRQ